MDKEDAAYIYSGILLSHKRKQNLVICIEVDGPRDRVQSAVSQKEKNKYRMLTHIYGIKNKKQKQKQNKNKKNKQKKNKVLKNLGAGQE